MKKILHINTYDVDGIGKAVLRIHNYLIGTGFDSKILVKDKKTNIEDVIELPKKMFLGEIVRKAYVKLKKKFFPTPPIATHPKYHFFNPDETEHYVEPTHILQQIGFTPDVIIVYWIARFCNFRTVVELQKLTKARLLFYPLDMSPFTGGCHYAWDCKGFELACHTCPAILSGDTQVAAKNFAEKMQWVAKADLEIISVSKHVEEQLLRSLLFKNKRIHKGVYLVPDKAIFKWQNKQEARKKLDLPENKKILFIGASNFNDERKGLSYFEEALLLLKGGGLEKELIIVVAGQKRDVQLAYETHYVGMIGDDETLANYYQATDAFVCTSVEDSGPMMINESICCGTPVVAFNMGVAKDLVITNQTGYLAELCNAKSLAEGLRYVLSLPTEDYTRMQENCMSISNKLLNNNELMLIL